MKNQLRQTPNQKPSTKLKARLLIIGLSVVAFAAALGIFLMMDFKPDNSAKADNGLPDTGKSPIVQNRPDHVPGRIILRVESTYRNQCSNDKIDIETLTPHFAKFGITKVQRSFPQAFS